MSIRFTCGKCGKAFAVSEQFAGKRVKCSGCGVPLVVPGARPAPAAPVPALPVTAIGGPPPLAAIAVCPGCQGSLPPGAVLCTACGFDLRTGRRLTTRAEAGPPKRPGLQSWHIAAGVVGAVVLVAIVGVVLLVQVFVKVARQASVQRGRAVMAAAAARAPQQPVYPPRPVAQRLGRGIEFYPITIDGKGPGLPMEVQLYLPAGRHQPHSLPCVFVAPAGTRMLHGMHLSEGDTPEHLPYARAGFAVVAYELSGHFTERPRITLGMLAGPIRQFMAADGGLANARAAIDFVSRQVPEVDPNRLYAAGHSSAATMALNLAAADRRIRACCAYAPACDVEARWRGELAGMERLVPGVSDFAARLSPVEHVADFSCPIYLFHADNDERVDVADNQDFADALKQAGKQVTFVRIRFGGHYESMISDGIPGGIHWLEGLGAKPLPPVVNGSEAVSPGTSGG